MAKIAGKYVDKAQVEVAAKQNVVQQAIDASQKPLLQGLIENAASAVAAKVQPSPVPQQRRLGRQQSITERPQRQTQKPQRRPQRSIRQKM